MLFLKGYESTGYVISEGSYQKLKHVVTVEALVTLCERDGVVRLGKAYLNDQVRDMGVQAMYTIPINDERMYASDYAIRAEVGLPYFEIATRPTANILRVWQIPERFLSIVVFAYYSSPDRVLYEELLDRLCNAVTYSR